MSKTTHPILKFVYNFGGNRRLRPIWLWRKQDLFIVKIQFMVINITLIVSEFQIRGIEETIS